MHPNARKILLLLLHEKNIYKRRMSGQQKRQQMSCYKNLWFIASEPISFHYHQQHQSKFLVKIGLAIKSCHRVVLNLNYVTCGASLMHSMFFHFFVFEEKHHFPSVRNNEILDSSDDHKVQASLLKRWRNSLVFENTFTSFDLRVYFQFRSLYFFYYSSKV